ncbi:MAG: alanine--glyoxylate aminotransferase family protein [Gemmatimonadota bacterium]
MALPTLGHLDPDFLALMDDVSVRLRPLFGLTGGTVFPVSGTGSAGMEAALANVLEPGDTAIIGVNGVFGTRLVEMARRMGAQVVEIQGEWGDIVSPEAVLEAVEAHPAARVVALVHAETSTGVHQPLAEVGAYLRERPTLFLVDTVTSLGGVPVEMDRLGLDVCYSGTQKCLGVPPGLAPIAFSEKAMARLAARTRSVQSWYLDVSLISAYIGSERRYHHTAPINMFYALHEGLVMVEEEGVEARHRRHAEVGARLQGELTNRGFSLFAREGYRLPQLTSVLLPDGLEEAPLRKRLLLEEGIEIGGGLGPTKGRLWRIGLMGSGASHENVDRLIQAVDRILPGVKAT